MDHSAREHATASRLTGSYRPDALRAGLLAALVLAALSAGTVIVINELMADALEREAQGYLQAIDEQEAEFWQLIAALRQLGDGTCDAEMVGNMRELLLSARYAKELHHYQDGRLTCTSSDGVLAEPDTLPPPAYVGPRGARVWLEDAAQGTDLPANSSLVAIGRFGVVFNYGLYMGDVLPDALFSWESVGGLGTSAFPVHAQGRRGVFRGITRTSDEGQASSYAWLLNGVYYEQCHPQNGFCIGVLYPYGAMLERYNTGIAILALMMLATTALSHVAARQWLSRQRTLEARVRNAVQHDRFEVVFQTVVEADSQHISGIELLARLEDDYGPITPDAFIPIIQRLDLTWRFTESIATKGFSALDRVASPGWDLKVAVNVFPTDLISGAAAALADLKPSWLKAGDLVLETTEIEALDLEQAKPCMDTLSGAGITFALDDFGIGYSNVYRLKRLPFSYLKVDKSFVRDIDGSELRSSLIPQICDMAEALGLVIVAEGVETRHQAMELRQLGVGYLQGWYYSCPMGIDSLERILRDPRSLDDSLAQTS